MLFHPPTIQNIRKATDEEWDATWRQCDSATYFHSREWACIWSAYTYGALAPAAKTVVFSDGMRALLPLSAQRYYHGALTKYISSPADTYGGWLSSDPLSTAHAQALAQVLLHKFIPIQWCLNPYDHFVGKLTLPGAVADATQVLDLRQGINAIFKNLSKGHKSATTKAAKAGVQVRQASTSDDWDAYYHVYEDSLRRWGNRATSNYKRDFFAECYKRNSNNIKLWLALHQNAVVAGAVCLYDRKHVCYWHGAALDKYFALRPVNLLLFEIIKQASEQGHDWFDFLPSGKHEGVRKFKENFGAAPLPCPVISRQSRVFTILNRTFSALRLLLRREDNK